MTRMERYYRERAGEAVHKVKKCVEDGGLNYNNSIDRIISLLNDIKIYRQIANEEAVREMQDPALSKFYEYMETYEYDPAHDYSDGITDYCPVAQYKAHMKAKERRRRKFE